MIFKALLKTILQIFLLLLLLVLALIVSALIVTYPEIIMYVFVSIFFGTIIACVFFNNLNELKSKKKDNTDDTELNNNKED